MKQDADPDPTYDPREFDPSASDHNAVDLDSGSLLTEFNSRDASDLEDGHSDIEDGESDLADTSFMSWEQPLAFTNFPNDSMGSLANQHPLSSGNFSGIIYTPTANPQFSDYLNQVEYFPLPIYPAGMPREKPVSLFGEMVSDAPVLFDSAKPGIQDQDTDLPRPIAPLDYNPGGLHPVIPFTIIPPEEMYQNRPPLPLQASWVSVCAQRNVKQEDGQQPLESSQIQGYEQAPLFQGRGFQMPSLEPQFTRAEHYQEDYFWAQQHMELKRNQEIYQGGHLYQTLRSPHPDFDVDLPLLDNALPSFKEHFFPAPRKMCQEGKTEAGLDQPSTPKSAKRQSIYGTPHNGPQNVPMTYPPKQAKAHREDKRRRKSDFVFSKDTEFDIENSVSQLTRVLKEIAEDVKSNPITTVSQPFSPPSVEEIGPFHYSLRDITMATRQRSDPMNLDSVRWEKTMRVSAMNKRSSPDAKRNDTPSLGREDSSSGQDSPTPKSKKARVELCTPSKKASATTRSTSKKTPTTKPTDSSKAKRKDSKADRAQLQSPPTKSSRTRQSIPTSWEEASASDILMFELRKQDAEFPTIAKVLRTTCGLYYLSRTLRNRYWKIKTRIGDMPNNLQAKKKDGVAEEMDEETSGLSSPTLDEEEDT